MFPRTLIVWALGLPVTIFLFIIVLLSLLVDRTGAMIHSIGALWCRIILALSGVRVRVNGAENIPGDGPVIFLANHQGAFDIPALQANLPVQFRWVAKKSLFSIPVIGWSMTLAGYIAIERENPQLAYKSMEDAAERIRGGTSVLIFPEGTRSETGKLLPFKRGAFTLAAKSGATVVPVAISGTSGIMKKGSLLINPAEVTITIREPMASTGVEEKDLRNMTKRAISEALG